MASDVAPWTPETTGRRHPNRRLVWCWADGGDEVGSTCLLAVDANGHHDGGHVFTPDDEIERAIYTAATNG